MNWKKYIEYLRKIETEIAFQEFSDNYFESGLELGAGVGSQSLLLKKYVKKLISTDLDPNRLKLRGQGNGIYYKICDAENISSYFPPKSFDLVFASNLFEHLPDPLKALKGIKEVLKDDGIVILIMPSSFWAIQRYLLHYPFIIFRVLFKRSRPKVVKIDSAKVKEAGISNTSRGNNLKADMYLHNHFLKSIRWPEPHGVSSSNFEEVLSFSKKHWFSVFNEANYRIVKVAKGPVMSGRGFGLNKLRKVLEKIGLCGEYIYYIKPFDI